MDKKKLYEHIMANVAKEVKKALLENYHNAPDFILDEVIDDEYINRMAVKLVKDTDIKDYKNLVKTLCGEYSNDNRMIRNTLYRLASTIYEKLKEIAIYDLDKIEELSPANNDFEKYANEYIYLRSQNMVDAYEYILENKDTLYDMSLETAYRQFIKYIFMFLRDLYI